MKLPIRIDCFNPEQGEKRKMFDKGFVPSRKMTLGGMGENFPAFRRLLDQVITWHESWRHSLAQSDPPAAELTLTAEEERALGTAIQEFLERFSNNVPLFSPRYAAQMARDPALPAVLGYIGALLLNPNNHAYEGGPATTEMEMEVTESLLRMAGFEGGWGHLTSGGSLANMEALWAVRDFRKSGIVVFSRGSHYSWKRISSILRVDGLEEIDVDEHYRMDLNHLEEVLRSKNVMLVVANLGTTGTGAIDSLSEIVRLRQRYGFHLHVDAAYGGYARTVILDPEMRILPQDSQSWLEPYVYAQLASLHFADSITIDPHKHGLSPYGAGAVLYKDERLRNVILNTAPYTYHKLDKPNIGMWTLEGSRPGASAAAAWLTLRMIPLDVRGFGSLLSDTMRAARDLSRRIGEVDGMVSLVRPDLDILCFFGDGEGEKRLSRINERTEGVYRILSIENPRAPFILSKLVLTGQPLKKLFAGYEIDAERVSVMRGVFLKPYMRSYGTTSYTEKLLTALRDALPRE